MAFNSERTRTIRRAREARLRERRPAAVRPVVRREEPIEPVPPPPPPARDWRSDVIGLSGLNVLAGIWLIIAPWVLGYSGRDPRWNDVVFGAIVGVLALIRISGAYRETWLSWINAAIGVWLFIAAWTIDHTGTAGGNDIILGVIVFLLAVGSASAVPLRRAQPPAA